MEEYEVMLKKIIDNSVESGGNVEVLHMKYEAKEREAIDYLKRIGYITNLRFFPDNCFGCDITYEGQHHFK